MSVIIILRLVLEGLEAKFALWPTILSKALSNQSKYQVARSSGYSEGQV